MFTKEQEQALAAPLDGNHVKQRPGAGKQSLSYIEGWRVIEQAIQIFGAGNWSRETVQLVALHEPKLVTDPDSPQRNMVVASYFCRCRLTIYSKDGSRSIVREGCGAVRGFAKTAGEAAENALKSAETDSCKRAFATLGSSLGLALYDPLQAKVTPRGKGRRQLPKEEPINSGFDRPTTSQRAIAVRNGKRGDDLPV
jgi:DNA repair and recombination protein RAD52